VIRYRYLLLVILLFQFNASADVETPESWYKQGQESLGKALRIEANKHQAKNIILFIGDGMGISTITAARILAGQLQGKSGEEHSLSFELLPYAALSKTYNTNQQTPDSAGTMTAIMTGVKTESGFISVNQKARRKDCASSKGNHLLTLLEELEEHHYATGVISTARITHATPAATYAHTVEREWEGDSLMPGNAIQEGCQDIAMQLLTFSYGDGIDVVMGGGRRYFFPKDVVDPEYPGETGKREDARNLITEWEKRYSNAAYIWNEAQFANIKAGKVTHLLGLFEPSHMQFESDRKNDGAGEPSLADMTGLAIEILKKNEKGYFLMVEGGRIDHAHHYGNAYRALHDTVAFSDAVSVALKQVDLENTLIIVTADHSHVFTMGGYPIRGNPILGKVIHNDRHGEAKNDPELAKDNKPYTTLGYYNGDGFAVVDDITERDEGKDYGHPGRADIRGIETTRSDYYQESMIPMIDETHGGEDVAIFAGGPWAHLFHGVHEQHYIYHVMRHALGFDRDIKAKGD
jgi:alkaline phosphatase